MAGPHPRGLCPSVESEGPRTVHLPGCLLAKPIPVSGFACVAPSLCLPGPASVSAPGALGLGRCLLPDALLLPADWAHRGAAREEGRLPVSFVHILSD